MPAIATMTLADGQATPANHNFTPDGINAQGVASYVDRGHGAPVTNYVITTKLRPPLARPKNAPASYVGVYRHSTKVVVPKTAVVDGIEQKTGECSGTIEFVFPETATELERSNCFAFVLSALQHAQVYTGIKTLENTW